MFLLCIEEVIILAEQDDREKWLVRGEAGIALLNVHSKAALEGVAFITIVFLELFKMGQDSLLKKILPPLGSLKSLPTGRASCGGLLVVVAGRSLFGYWKD